MASDQPKRSVWSPPLLCLRPDSETRLCAKGLKQYGRSGPLRNRPTPAGTTDHVEGTSVLIELSYAPRGWSMKIFVSSRLDELFLERKTAVEVIHFEGHTPLYIETERDVGEKLAKKTMLSLIADADALVSIHFLTAGRKFPMLRQLTPIEFELEEFRRLRKGKPIFIFRRTQEDTLPNPTMLQYFDDVAKAIGIAPIPFQRPEDLQRKLRNALSAYEHEADDEQPPYRVTVRYVGPDFIGLIAKISEVLFTICKFNIDYISHASQGGHATIATRLRATTDSLEQPPGNWISLSILTRPARHARSCSSRYGRSMLRVS